MGVIACKFYRIEAAADQALDVVRDLELLSVFEPVEPLFPIERESYDKHADFVQFRLDRYQRVIELLEAQSSDGAEAAELDRSTLKRLQAEAEALDEVVRQVLEAGEQRTALHEQVSRLQSELERLKPFAEVSLPVFDQYELVSMRLFVATPDQKARLMADVRDAAYVNYHELKANEDQVVGVLATTQDKASALDKLLEGASSQVINPADLSAQGSPQAHVVNLRAQQTEVESAIEGINQQLSEWAMAQLADLRQTYDLLRWEKDSVDALRYVGYSFGLPDEQKAWSEQEIAALKVKMQDDSTVLSEVVRSDRIHLDGWADPDKVTQLKQRLQGIDKGIVVHELGGEADPEVRSVLKNNPIVRPFEMITTLMGTPHPHEIDPSVFVAPFFVAFFGFALGDAGYGLLMTAITGWILLTKKLSQTMRDAVMLMLYCGLSTVFFGALTGGWFGADLETLGGPLGETLRSWQVVSVQGAIIQVLAGALAIGFIQQLFGLILGVAGYVKAGKTSEGLQGPGTWLLLLLSVALWATTSNVNTLSSLQPVASGLFWVSLVLFAFGQGQATKNIFLRPLVGLAGLFNITGYLSNTLSYARLLALGLATGVIGSVVNFIAGMAGGDGFIGFLITALVLVIGHTFNIAMNLLGTFINVVRLQLVEFFPRFFEAKGIALTPLAVETRYTRLSPALSGQELKVDRI